MSINKEYKSHESYGMVQLNRCHGGAKRLYASAIKNHNETMTLRIYKGEFAHDLHKDWYSTAGMLPIIEIEMSPAQFAEFITTMNVSSGVPCTIRSIQGKRMADPPADENEVERVQTGFDKEMREFSKRLDKDQADIEALLAKPSVGKADRAEIINKIKMIKQHIASNMPFALNQFQEATEKVTTAAKAEVEAFMVHAITSAGLDAIRGKTPQEAMKGIPEPDPPGTVIKAGTLNSSFCALDERDEE